MIVIDEPELHLHRSLMDKLWNKLEELSLDKTLVYITHDLDFAASRTGAKKIWVQGYANAAWTWIDLPSCRIPDDCIDKNRYPLFMARAVLQELIESLHLTTGSAKP